MKTYIKYLCAVVLLIGTSASAWGVTITLKVWDHSAGAYITYGTFEKGNKPGEDPQLYDSYYEVYYPIVAWAPGGQTDIVYPGASGSDYYAQGYAWPKSNYSGDATTLYAVYYAQADDADDYDYYYTTKPSISLSLCEIAPTVTAGSNSAVASTSATVTCASGISALGDCSITSYGFVYGTSSNPTTSNSTAQVGTSYTTTSTSFSKSLTGLSASTKYYVRPYATNGAGTSYGTQTSFTTLAQYTISYDNNGGSGTISDQIKDHGVTATLNGGASFSKTGYTLSKWNTASGGGGTDYALSGSYTGNADLELYAIWTPQEYTITLNNQSATSGGSTSITVTFDASTNLTGTPAITVPTKTGYTFGGYYTETSGSGVQVIAANGNVNASANDGGSNTYTDASKNWKYANDLTLYAKWTANEYTITLNGNGATTAGSSSVTATYNSSTLPSITNPEKTEKNFAGWYSGEGGTGSLVITTSGQLKENVDGYTGAGGIWTKTSGTTLYAKWVTTIYTVTYNMHGHGYAPEDEEVESGNLATKPADPVAEDWRFLGWYKEDTYTNEWVYSTQTVTSDATIHAKWEAVSYDEDTYKAWCEPDITITGDIHLTSTNGIAVYATSTTSNLIRIQSNDLSGVNKLEIKYLDANDGDAEVAKGSSVFRFCNDGTVNYNVADGSQIDVSESNTYDQTFSISYTPTAYNVTHHYKLQITMKRGTRVLKTVTHDLYGRALPEEFVIATKGNDNIWYALPNTIVDNGSAVTPIKITVNDATTPTAATYAPDITVFKGDGRYAANSNRYAVRFTDGVVKDAKLNHLQISSSTSIHYPWLSYTGSSTNQDWWLKSTDCSAYELNIPTSGATSAYKFGIYGGNIGYFPSVTSGSIFLLPITNKLIDNPAIVTEWGKKSVILDVDAQSAVSAQARLGDGAPEAVAIFSQTRTSVAGSETKYNYTLRFGTLDFSAHKGELLYIDWLDAEDAVISTSQITIPWIIAADRNMYKDGETTKGPWDTEVHVLPGVTLTANTGSYSPSGAAINELHIYPGATVNITTGTLTAKTLIMRNGWTRAGSKEYDVARLHVTKDAATLKATNVYADWYIDFDQYYPVAVPWSVTTSGMSYVNSNSAASAGVKMRYYDGASRAANGQTGVADGANWKLYSEGGKAYPATLTPGIGYAMTAKRPKGKAFSIVRMPLTLPSGAWTEGTWTTNGESGAISTTHKDEVTVTAHGAGEGKPAYTVGWNFIANPYMALYQGAITHSVSSDYDVEYVNIPDVDFKEYGQYPVGAGLKKLTPATGFFIQAEATGTLTFGTANRKPSAPSYRKEEQAQTTPKQKAYIVLSNAKEEDMMGLIVSERYTEAFEINADLEKLLGDGASLKTYMNYGGMNMAYVAINEELAKEWIPVTIRVPKNGECTFAIHEASIADELEGVYLIDYAENGKITNLIEENYTFESEAGTIVNRFAINAIIGVRKTPEAVDAINAQTDTTMPVKFLYQDNVYILHHGAIYDATGKRVKKINK